MRLEAPSMSIRVAVLVHRAGADLAPNEPGPGEPHSVIGRHVDPTGEGDRIHAVVGPNQAWGELVERRIEILLPHLERLGHVPIHVDDGVVPHF